MIQNSINVVIADDSPIFLDGIKVMLAEHPEIHVKGIALDGEELVALVDQCMPDVVITDLQMPVMNGIEATRMIKQKWPLIAIIALTSFGDENLVLEMMDAGASGYFLKTTSKEALANAIHVVNEGGRYYCKTTSQRLAGIIAGRTQSEQLLPSKNLTEKELDIIKLICQEHNTKEIAQQLNHSPKTIDAYRLKLMEKISVNTSAGIVIYAIRTGLYRP